MSYRAPWWLANRHAQSVLPTRFRYLPNPGVWRHIATRDGDRLEVKTVEQGAPLALILHGLGGCAESLYVRGMQRALNRAGFSTWAWNARGAGRPNLRGDTYHGGRYCDVQDLIQAAGARPMVAVGFSLGAAMLVNTLGRSAPGIQAAVAVSCPFGFVDNVAHLDGPRGRIYRHYLLHRLRHMARRKRAYGQAMGADWAHRYPGDSELSRLRTFQAFDDRLTAPLNGFQDAMDLYHEVDPAQVLDHVQAPLLMLQADDDPLFVDHARPPTPLPKSCEFELTRGGGHVGFVHGPWPWQAQYYAEQRAVDFLTSHLGDLK